MSALKRSALVTMGALLPLACFNFAEDRRACEESGWCAEDAGVTSDAGGGGGAQVPVVQAAPTIAGPDGGTGQVLVGETLSVTSPGAWDPAASVYTYGWQLCLRDAGSCTALAAEGSSLRAPPIAVDAYVRARVVAANDGGSSAEAYSNLTGPLRRAVGTTPTHINGFETAYFKQGSGSVSTLADAGVTTAAGRTGIYALRTETTLSNPAWVSYTIPSSAMVAVVRVAFRVVSAGTVNSQPVLSMGGASERVLYADVTAGTLHFDDQTPTIANVPLRMGGWHVLDVRVEQGLAVEWRIDGVPQTPAPNLEAMSSTVRLGSSSQSVEITTEFDDLFISVDQEDWPLGDGRVHPLRPVDAGSGGCSCFSDCGAGTQYFPAEAISEWPPSTDATSCMEQTTSNTQVNAYKLSTVASSAGRIINGAQLRVHHGSTQATPPVVRFGVGAQLFRQATFNVPNPSGLAQLAAFKSIDGGVRIAYPELNRLRFFWGAATAPAHVDSALLEVDIAP